MSDLKELEQLRADLELVTKTAKVLATKLEKMSTTLDSIFASLEGKPIPKAAISPAKEVAPKPTPTPVQAEPRPSITSDKVNFGAKSDSRAGRLLDNFLSQVQTMNSGKEISEALSRLRDQVMQSADIGFHPAFHEMGRYASKIKNVREISAEEREALFENIHDWKNRLTS